MFLLFLTFSRPYLVSDLVKFVRPYRISSRLSCDWIHRTPNRTRRHR